MVTMLYHTMEMMIIFASIFNGTTYGNYALSYYGDDDNICLTCLNSTTGDILQIYTEGLVATQIKTNSKNNLQIYPNPTNGIINIKTQEQVKKITISDITGKVILKTTKTKIDFSKQKRGIYFLQIETNEGILTEKIIFE